MRQRQISWKIRPPSCNRLGHVRLRALTKMPIQRIRTHEQRQPEVRQRIEKARLPKGCTLLARRFVSAARIVARKAKADRNDRDAARVVEGLAVDPEPVAKAIAAWVIEREPGVVDANAGGLADDGKPGRLAHTQYRADAVRQIVSAYTAGAN